MQKIDCKNIAESIYKDIQSAITDFRSTIRISIIDGGSDEASKKYISLKMQKAIELGVKADLVRFSESSKIEEVLTKIDSLNKDKSVNGVLVQLPLYAQLAPYKHRILNSINPLKDVDGLSAINFGLYSQDIMNGILPATVDACLEVIKSSYKNEFQGSNILIINNSDLIGKPLGMVLSTLGATVTIANEFTSNLDTLLRSADIVISATGKGHLFTENNLKEGALVIDVTSIRKEDKTIGDFKIENEDKDLLYTPVPGGIGPLTIACLFRNLINLAKLQQ